MPRLIDADALMERFAEMQRVEPDERGRGYSCNFRSSGGEQAAEWYTIEDAVENAPTIDAVPVVHGEWTIDGMNEYELSYGCIGYEPRYRCSRCGITTESYLRTEKPIMPEDADFPNYCPNCGAKMKGEENER